MKWKLKRNKIKTKLKPSSGRRRHSHFLQSFVKIVKCLIPFLSSHFTLMIVERAIWIDWKRKRKRKKIGLAEWGKKLNFLIVLFIKVRWKNDSKISPSYEPIHYVLRQAAMRQRIIEKKNLWWHGSETEYSRLSCTQFLLWYSEEHVIKSSSNPHQEQKKLKNFSTNLNWFKLFIKHIEK